MRRGGWRQVLEAAEADGQVQPRVYTISRLAAGHLLKFSDGLQSAMEFADHMQDEVVDMSNMQQMPHPMVQRLSAIGGGQHAHPGLKSLLEGLGFTALITQLPHPVHVSHILKPKTLIRIMHQHYPKFFERSLGADSNVLRDFWTEFLRRPRTRTWAAAHPALRDKTPADLVCMVPCRVHADAGPCSKTKSAQCVIGQACSVLAVNSILNSFRFHISKRQVRVMKEHGKCYSTTLRHSGQELSTVRK